MRRYRARLGVEEQSTMQKLSKQAVRRQIRAIAAKIAATRKK